MSNDSIRQWGIFTVAIIMAFVHLFTKSTAYIFYWAYIAYVAYNGTIRNALGLIKAVLIFNIALVLILGFFGDREALRLVGFSSSEQVFILGSIPILVNVFILLLSRGLPEQDRVASLLSGSGHSITSKQTGPSEKGIGGCDKRLYDGADQAIEKKLANLLSFSRDVEEIKRLLFCEGDLYLRSRLIEEALKQDYQGFINSLDTHLTNKFSRLSFSDSELKEKVLSRLHELQTSNPHDFSVAYSVASDLGDGLDIDSFLNRFPVCEAPVKSIPNEIVGKIIRDTVSGDDLIQALNAVGFEASSSWAGGRGRYTIKYGDDVQYFNFSQLKEFCKEDVVMEMLGKIGRS